MRDWSKKITSFLELILIINIHDKIQCFDPVSALVNAKLVCITNFKSHDEVDAKFIAEVIILVY